jgi:alpha/beta superfamily hydrolase
MPTLALHAPHLRSHTPRLRSLTLDGPAGRLEALLNAGSQDALCTALICHPHPLGGGSMHNKVVYHAMKALNDAAFVFAWPVLRFNFRGMGLSTGDHDGSAEAGDVLTALNWLRSEFQLPILLVGFSFGAVMSIAALENAAGASDVFALAALGLPVSSGDRHYTYPTLPALTLPKIFISGARDGFAPVDELRAIVETAADPKEFALIPDADHFFNEHLAEMQSALTSWLKNLASLPRNLSKTDKSKEKEAIQ